MGHGLQLSRSGALGLHDSMLGAPDKTRGPTERARGKVAPIVILPWSGKQVLDHMTVDIRQATFDSVMVKSQSFVIDAEQVQHGGVKIRP